MMKDVIFIFILILLMLLLIIKSITVYDIIKYGSKVDKDLSLPGQMLIILVSILGLISIILNF